MQPRLSPDGHWLAYASDESGAWKVYVCPFPSGSGKWTISPDGGSQPAWRHDGNELYFITSDGDLAASAITGSPFDARPPIRLFRTQLAPMVAPFRQTVRCGSRWPVLAQPALQPNGPLDHHRRAALEREPFTIGWRRKVHPAESSTEVLETLGFRPPGGIDSTRHGHGPIRATDHMDNTDVLVR